jgi:hypothetical protein
MLSLACHECAFYDDCGGIEPDQALLGCFDLCRSACDVCDRACPRRHDFFECLREIKGYHYHQNMPIEQKVGQLPFYVPMVHHGCSRDKHLEIPMAAVSLHRLFRLAGDCYRCNVDSPSGLRDKYKLSRATRIIAVGIGKDKYLERYWRYRRRDRAPEFLAQLCIDAVIAPNFSHFLDVPRTDNLFNRKRQLICLEEFQRAGLSPVPHLNAVTAADWRFWRDYLRQNGQIRCASVEFQTGNRNRNEGERVIDHLAWLRDELGRALHIIGVGASQFTQYFASRSVEFTLLDSRPFMTAVKRKVFLPQTGTLHRPDWVSRQTKPGESIDEILVHNIQQYTYWTMRRCRAPDHIIDDHRLPSLALSDSVSRRSTRS